MRKNVAILLPVYYGSNHSPFLGMAYLASSLKENGHKCIILDEDALTWIYKDYNTPLEAARKRIIIELNKNNINIICLYINTTNYRNALDLLLYLQQLRSYTLIVVGGPHITTSYKTFDRLHSELFDYAIVGEGEKSLPLLCNEINNIQKEISVSGVFRATQSDKLIYRNLANIDTLPFPDRNAFYFLYTDTEKQLIKEHYCRVFYSKLTGFNNNYARVIASRGCYNSCKFCSPGLYWKDPHKLTPSRRIRNPISVVDEIELLVNNGVSSIYFDDPTFPIKSNPVFFKSFSEEILNRNLNFNWGAPICSNEIDSDILDKLQRIGFKYTYFGLENYNAQYLSNMNKKQNIKECLNLIKECNIRDIHCDASYQIGLPNESFDDMKKSIDWIFSNGIEFNTFYSITALWPETQLAKQYDITSEYYEPDFDKSQFNKRGLYFFEQGNKVLEDFYSNCSGTFHFINEDDAINMKYYIFDSGLTNRFERSKRKM